MANGIHHVEHLATVFKLFRMFPPQLPLCIPEAECQMHKVVLGNCLHHHPLHRALYLSFLYLEPGIGSGKWEHQTEDQQDGCDLFHSTKLQELILTTENIQPKQVYQG